MTRKQLIFAAILITALSACKKNTSDDNSGGTNPTAFSVTHQFDMASNCSEIYMTAKADKLGRNYLYVAAKEGGLKIYEISSTPVLIRTIPVTSFYSLHVMNLSQNGNYVYLALGNHLGINIQNPGLAIIDVSNPAAAFVTYAWQSSNAGNGAGSIETEGNYAYLCAMKKGLMIFDITNKTAPVYKSTFMPSIYYPDANPDPAKYNARGLIVKNDIVYLCYDAGGLRIINATDKLNPRQTGKYANPDMNGKPRAYNNIVVDGNIIYAAVDYCGLEVLNITDTANIRLTAWWNPWNCETNPFNWFSSNGHTNEIAFDASKKLIFLSSGKSDLQVVDVNNPSAPAFKYEYGGINNGIGTWGVSISMNKIFLSYICSAIPFPSNWTGVKILSYN